jgi:hypothetical protein
MRWTPCQEEIISTPGPLATGFLWFNDQSRHGRRDQTTGFDPFFTTKGSQKWTRMSVAYRIINRHKGRLRFSEWARDDRSIYFSGNEQAVRQLVEEDHLAEGLDSHY